MVVGYKLHGAFFYLVFEQMLKVIGCLFCGKYLCFKTHEVKLHRGGEKRDTRHLSSGGQRERGGFVCRSFLGSAKQLRPPGLELMWKEWAQSSTQARGSSTVLKAPKGLFFGKNLIF